LKKYESFRYQIEFLLLVQRIEVSFQKFSVLKFSLQNIYKKYIKNFDSTPGFHIQQLYLNLVTVVKDLYSSA